MGSNRWNKIMRSIKSGTNYVSKVCSDLPTVKRKGSPQRWFPVSCLLSLKAYTSREVKIMVETNVKQNEDEGRAGPPEWINTAFISEALKSSGEQVEVENIEVQYAAPPGSNYCSRIFRVAIQVHDKRKRRSLLVKIPPEGESVAKIVDRGGHFQKETLMFTEILPAISNLLKKNMGEQCRSHLNAKCVYHGDQPQPFLVLQDLKEENFYVADRCVGLNLNQATLVMQTLGRFHGASHFLLKEKPEFFEIMTNPFEGAAMFSLEEFADSMKTLCEAIGQWSVEYKEKLLGLRRQLFIQNQIANRPRPGKFNALAHGDLWTTNIMFKDNEKGETVDIRLLDFQLSHVTNPAIDIILLVYTSLQDDVFSKDRDNLVEIYVNSLSSTLASFGVKPITLEEFREYIDEARAYIFMAALVWLPFFRMEKEKLDMEKLFTEGAAAQANIYQTPEFEYWMKKLLPEFDRQGMFDNWSS